MTLNTAPHRPLEMRPLSKKLGVEIRGVDLADLDDAVFAKLKEAFDIHGVVVLPGQKLTPEELRAFGRRFGPLETHTLLQYTLPDYPEIYVLSNLEENGKPLGAHNEGIGWHTDLSYKERPVMATMLYGIMCPPEGGDTLFADMSAAWDALPEARKAELDGKKIQHSYQKWMATRADRAPLTEEQKAKTPDVTHPLVRTHPATGRKSLFIGTGTVYGLEGVSNPEGKRIVDELVDYATGEDFVLVHKWTEGDVVMWDNRRTLHTGTLFDDTKYKRHIHRMMVQGDVPA
ncbi:TauD/TfdA dioxygenase family protein [Celeribacter indicus]|uniref:Taurine catabolism dioxygenase TauD/TfdA n=1 Tax=Celeribacter indicus TaxID=1208324 RepID=A0A0B5DTI9_9RHOB|nr:TauD/TfdA family dioxygenase [Celeribacter indicus]AJE46748.1 taurine catabolism dioxygenase TauD/TfdA [Celeribacter indicus]SDX05486.1 taurine dioxygenase [Celeribacter indicus]